MESEIEFVPRLSDYYELGKEQPELDFVDVPVHTDLRLFLDPYALGLEDDPWFIEATNLIVDFFDTVLAALRSYDERRALELLFHLTEPNETHLGLSRGEPQGRGLGTVQSRQIYDRLRKSRAVRTGFLCDLEDAELVVPGIARDKISDMTTNVIRSKLIEYTTMQCSLHGIPTREIAAGHVWDPEFKRWRGVYASLPILGDRRLLLVPKAAVRRDLTYDHNDYYNHFVLNYLQAEHLRAGSALVRVLRDGRRKVYKKDLRERYRLSKEFLYRFSEEHPEVLESYRDSLPQTLEFVSDEALERVQPEPRTFDPEELIRQLEEIPTGNEHASAYHTHMVGIIEFIFYPHLWKPEKECEIHEGRKRIDLVCNNVAKDGFFWWLHEKANVVCPYIVIECKNYSTDPANPELDQLLGRFSPRRGKFGLLCCRQVTDRDKLDKRCRDAVRADQGFPVVLQDRDIIAMIRAKQEGDEQTIWEILNQRYTKLVR